MAEVKEDVAAETKEVAAETKKKTPKKFVVETPVKDYCGVVATVHFAKGKAEVYDGHLLNWFKKKGYKVTPIK